MLGEKDTTENRIVKAFSRELAEGFGEADLEEHAPVPVACTGDGSVSVGAWTQILLLSDSIRPFHNGLIVRADPM